MPGHLELRMDDEVLCYYLHGKPVRQGTTIEVSLPDDEWLPVRFEWGGYSGDTPFLRMRLAGAEEGRLHLPERAVFRWPSTADHPALV